MSMFIDKSLHCVPKEATNRNTKHPEWWKTELLVQMNGLIANTEETSKVRMVLAEINFTEDLEALLYRLVKHIYCSPSLEGERRFIQN